jgi:hypothetical protein
MKTAQTPGAKETQPSCDRCSIPMVASGWVPQPDGQGGLRRVVVYRCSSCGRLFDNLWGFREGIGEN